MAELKPTRFGKYLLLEKLAVGGMAQLYRAKITGIQGFEKLIAIKTILPHFTEEKELLTSFIDEAKLAALLHHQNIVQIYDFGTMEDSYFIAMEYLLGRDLRHIISKSQERNLPLTHEHALYITSQVCSGLDYAHKLKDFQGKPLSIIHRDISPQNIFITYEGEVKIVDFGIAKAASQSTITQFGMIKGKIAYMSPEQASGQTVDHRSDIFSTGILLYEMVTGKRMFTGADTLQILAKVSKAEFDPPEMAHRGLPQKVYTILNRALVKDPEKRYQSCGDMLADLEECMFQLSFRQSARGLSQYMKDLFREEISLEGQLVRETAVTDIDRLGAAEREVKVEREAQEKPKTVSKPEPSPMKKGRGMYYGGIAAVLVVILAVIVVSFWPKERPGPTPIKEKATKPTPPAVAEPPGKPASSAVPSPAAKIQGKEPLPVAEAKALSSQAAEVMDKNPKEAKSLLLKAIELDPKNIRTHFQLGTASMRVKDYPRAIEAYQTVIELDPKFTDAFFNLGYLYAVKKDYAKSEEMYARVVALAPPYLDEALFNLGMVQERQGKRKQGIENLERAISINPNNEMAKKLLEKLKPKS